MTTKHASAPTEGGEDGQSKAAKDFKTMEMAELYRRLDTSDDGLSKGETARRLEKYGPNEITEHKTNPLL
ncbi:cation-transporting P-type ATPase [Demequina lutea]|uniref:Magnesium-transporting ATPase (P-type) n=1 Tax=Demequina lutea TaxID=431489 RepID=A0A7Y9ZCC4_9MICO|nr:cation-transporting P-type ATPase [Demequina lutea]NYI42747.1 magnesium-transporting ATPase (P-type) [Demequina lutea]